jgi:predicted branched-subunit amino acid permease
MTVTGDRKSMSGRVIVYSQVYLHAYWIGGAMLGATAAQWIPENIVGLDFALTALFVVLSIEAIRAQRGFAVPSMAVMCALIARLVDPEHMLPIAMGAFVGLLVIRYLVTRRKVRTDA